MAFAGAGGARHAYKLALAEELPPLPGVYLMRDRRGRALYVGKAADLRRRVRAYFGPGGRHGRLIGRALERLAYIDHEVCGSEFAALLRENDLIKALSPPCNRRGAGAGGRFLKISHGEMAPRLYVVPAHPARRRGLLRADPLGAPGARRGRVPSRPLSARRPGPGGARPRARRGGVAARRRLRGPRPARPAAARGDRRGAAGDRSGRRRRARGRPPGSPRRARAGPPRAPPGGRHRRAGRATRASPRRSSSPGGSCAAAPRSRPRTGATPARAGLDVVRRAARRPAALAPDALDEVTIVEGRLLDGAANGFALPLPGGWRTAEALSWIEGAVALACAPGAPHPRPDRESMRGPGAERALRGHGPPGRRGSAGLGRRPRGATLRIEDDRSEPAESARLLGSLAPARRPGLRPLRQRPGAGGRPRDGRAAGGRLEPRRGRRAPRRRPDG